MSAALFGEGSHMGPVQVSSKYLKLEAERGFWRDFLLDINVPLQIT